MAVVEVLILNGAGITVQNVSGNTPLHYAILRVNINIVEILLSKGANVNIKNYYNDSPLDWGKI